MKVQWLPLLAIFFPAAAPAGDLAQNLTDFYVIDLTRLVPQGSKQAPDLASAVRGTEPRKLGEAKVIDLRGATYCAAGGDRGEGNASISVTETHDPLAVAEDLEFLFGLRRADLEPLKEMKLTLNNTRFYLADSESRNEAGRRLASANCTFLHEPGAELVSTLATGEIELSFEQRKANRTAAKKLIELIEKQLGARFTASVEGARIELQSDQVFVFGVQTVPVGKYLK